MSDNKLTILLIEDDVVDRELVRRIVTAAGPEVTLTETGDAQAGLAALKGGGPFDVILLDYSLPGQDGGSVLREAIAAGVTAPIVVLTGHGDEQLAVELLRAGAADYVPKAALSARSTDLVQRVRQVVKLRRAEAEAEAAARSLQERVEFEQQLIGVVSHDLRNPLSTIRLSAQVLLARSKEEAQRGIIERIVRATGQADRMIRDLLDFTQARLGSGIPIEPSGVDFHAIVLQVSNDLRQGFPDRELSLEQTGPGTATMDPARITQMCSNLIGNAFQHSPAGSPLQVVSSVEGGVATLRVSNSGPAIAPEVMAHLFDPLRRGRSVRSSKAGSIGLGLFLSQAIAHAHGGRIEVVSNEKVTTFLARLPVAGKAATPA